MSNSNLNPKEIFDNNPIKNWGKMKLFVNMIKDHFNKSYTNLASWVLPATIGTIIYIISPLDFIPDVPFIGYLDDAAILAILVKFLGKEIDKYEKWKNEDRTIDIN